MDGLVVHVRFLPGVGFVACALCCVLRRAADKKLELLCAVAKRILRAAMSQTVRRRARASMQSLIAIYSRASRGPVLTKLQKITQLFETGPAETFAPALHLPPLVPSHATLAGDAKKPPAAGADRDRSSPGASSPSPAMSPAVVIEQYRRFLTDYEVDEIRKYPEARRRCRAAAC